MLLLWFTSDTRLYVRPHLILLDWNVRSFVAAKRGKVTRNMRHETDLSGHLSTRSDERPEGALSFAARVSRQLYLQV